MSTDRDSGGKLKQLVIVGAILAVLGLAVSVYSTLHHLDVQASGQTDAACNINDQFSCDDVALSRYSEILNIPLGVWGFGYFAASLVLLGVGFARGKTADEHLHAYVWLVGTGCVVSIILFGISHFAVGAYCITCMGVYALTFLQAGTLFAFRSAIPSGMTPRNVFAGGMSAAIAVAVVAALFAFVRPAPTALDDDRPSTASDLPTFSKDTFDIPLHKSAYSGLGEDYRKGSDNARVVIQEFADFQCPACRAMASTLDALAREYGDRVLIVFRNYPLDQSCNSSIRSRMHQQACKAAVMARCAGQYGKFWEYHDIVFGNQERMKDDQILKDWARQIGLTDEQIDTCWSSQDILAKVKEDIALGNKIGVDSTPTLFINGRKYIGRRGLAEIRAYIDELLLN